MPSAIPRLLLAPVLLLLTAAAPAFARSSGDRVAMAHGITINDGETANDIACAFCSVRIHGNVKGDVAVLFGSVTVDSDREITGDVAILGGNLKLAEGARVGGDVAIAAGRADAEPGATIRGDRSILEGWFWLLLPLAPLLILIGIIWLIVHLVRRNRYRPPVYPYGGRR